MECTAFKKTVDVEGYPYRNDIISIYNLSNLLRKTSPLQCRQPIVSSAVLNQIFMKRYTTGQEQKCPQINTSQERTRIKAYKTMKNKTPLCKACPRGVKKKKRKSFLGWLRSKLSVDKKIPDINKYRKTKFVKVVEEVVKKDNVKKKVDEKEEQEVVKSNRLEICAAESDVKKTESLSNFQQKPKKIVKNINNTNKPCDDKLSMHDKVAKLCRKYNIDSVWLKDSVSLVPHEKKENFNDNIKSADPSISNIVQCSEIYSKLSPQPKPCYNQETLKDNEYEKIEDNNVDVPCSLLSKKPSEDSKKPTEDENNCLPQLIELDQYGSNVINSYESECDKENTDKIFQYKSEASCDPKTEDISVKKIKSNEKGDNVENIAPNVKNEFIGDIKEEDNATDKVLQKSVNELQKEKLEKLKTIIESQDEEKSTKTTKKQKDIKFYPYSVKPQLETDDKSSHFSENLKETSCSKSNEGHEDAKALKMMVKNYNDYLSEDNENCDVKLPVKDDCIKKEHKTNFSKTDDTIFENIYKTPSVGDLSKNVSNSVTEQTTIIPDVDIKTPNIIQKTDKYNFNKQAIRYSAPCSPPLHQDHKIKNSPKLTPQNKSMSDSIGKREISYNCHEKDVSYRRFNETNIDEVSFNTTDAASISYRISYPYNYGSSVYTSKPDEHLDNAVENLPGSANSSQTKYKDPPYNSKFDCSFPVTYGKTYLESTDQDKASKKNYISDKNNEKVDPVVCKNRNEIITFNGSLKCDNVSSLFDKSECNNDNNCESKNSSLGNTALNVETYVSTDKNDLMSTDNVLSTKPSKCRSESLEEFEKEIFSYKYDDGKENKFLSENDSNFYSTSNETKQFRSLALSQCLPSVSKVSGPSNSEAYSREKTENVEEHGVLLDERPSKSVTNDTTKGSTSDRIRNFTTCAHQKIYGIECIAHSFGDAVLSKRKSSESKVSDDTYSSSKGEENYYKQLTAQDYLNRFNDIKSKYQSLYDEMYKNNDTQLIENSYSNEIDKTSKLMINDSCEEINDNKEEMNSRFESYKKHVALVGNECKRLQKSVFKEYDNITFDRSRYDNIRTCHDIDVRYNNKEENKICKETNKMSTLYNSHEFDDKKDIRKFPSHKRTQNKLKKKLCSKLKTKMPYKMDKLSSNRYLIDGRIFEKFVKLVRKDFTQKNCKIFDDMSKSIKKNGTSVKSNDYIPVTYKKGNKKLKMEIPTELSQFMKSQNECKLNLPVNINTTENLQALLTLKAQEFCTVMMELVKLFSTYKVNSNLLNQEITVNQMQNNQRVERLKDNIKSLQESISEYFRKCDQNNLDQGDNSQTNNRNVCQHSNCFSNNLIRNNLLSCLDNVQTHTNETVKEIKAEPMHLQLNAKDNTSCKALMDLVYIISNGVDKRTVMSNRNKGVKRQLE